MKYSLTELQLSLMRVLWEQKEATIAEVREALEPERELATSTVATLLSRLEKKGMVSHRTKGRRYVYRSEVTERDVRKSMVGEFSALANELFRGDVALLMNHLLKVQDVAPEDLARVRSLIEAKERELNRREE